MLNFVYSFFLRLLVSLNDLFIRPMVAFANNVTIKLEIYVVFASVKFEYKEEFLIKTWLTNQPW